MTKANNKNLILVTDLDGTLLDVQYSFNAALPALTLIQESHVPLILCSSKTKAEIVECRGRLNNTHPFIAENGGGIFLPVGYFKGPIAGMMSGEIDGFDVIKLGADYSDLRRTLHELRSEGFDVTGFGDMSVERVSELTGLAPEDAARAKERFFDEPFVFSGPESDKERLKKRIHEKGIKYTLGEFYHLLGESDKGRAVDILTDLYRDQLGEIAVIALGDSVNDIEMLERADYPVVIRKRDGSYNAEVLQKVRGCIRSEGIGPEGWNTTVLTLLHKLGIG